MSERIYLIDGRKNSYKANLHCHTNVSDGELSPLAVKESYKEKGYSVVAYTDHEILVPHDDLNDENFIALSGYELIIYADKHLPFNMRRVTHINIISKTPDFVEQPVVNMENITRLEKHLDFSNWKKQDDSGDDFEYSAENLNKIIKKAKDAGFIVSYNHPTWSKEDESYFTNIDGLYAMEIYNHECQCIGYDAYCPYIYEAMLRSGQRLGCVATDDTHSKSTVGGGFTMIQADNLEYGEIIAALENGDYYASRGPEIKALWYEDGVFHIECSPAQRIVVSNSGRRSPATSRINSEGVTHAEFPIDEQDLFVRFTVYDKAGNTANTRAYFRDEFEKTPAAIPDICNRRIGG